MLPARTNHSPECVCGAPTSGGNAVSVVVADHERERVTRRSDVDGRPLKDWNAGRDMTPWTGKPTLSVNAPPVALHGARITDQQRRIPVEAHGRLE